MSEAAHVTHGSEAGVGVKPAPRRTRTCVGCGERVMVAQPHDLVRLVVGPSGAVSVDEKGGSGRGAHVHARRACIERAAPAGLLRATKGRAKTVIEPRTGASAPLDADALCQAVSATLDRRIETLLRAASRSHELSEAVLAQAVSETERQTSTATVTGAALLVVACDAPSFASTPEVRAAIAEGRAVAWGHKKALGDLRMPMNGAGVDAIVVSSARVGAAVARAVRAAHAVSTAGPAVSRATNGRGGRGRAARRLAGSAPERRTAE